jgi:mono/diheme cytochrome c family protein
MGPDGMLGAEAMLAEGRRHAEAALGSLDELAGALRDLELGLNRAAALARARRAVQEARGHVDHGLYAIGMGQDVQTQVRGAQRVAIRQGGERRAALGSPRTPEHHHASVSEPDPHAPAGARNHDRREARPGGAATVGETVLGSQVFRLACAGCHGLSAEGKIGPRLVGTEHAAAEIEAIVTHGLPPKMPAFEQQLAPAEIQSVAAYVRSLNPEQRSADRTIPSRAGRGSG